ncbi:MAG: molybdate ABC transporter substrate-binding protein [Pirellulales bacterium]
MRDAPSIRPVSSLLYSLAALAALVSPRHVVAADDAPILVLVAASAQEAIAEAAKEFGEKHPGEIKFSPGPSQALAKQVLEGAPADLFLSASEEWTKAVEKRGLAAKVVPLLGNELVLIVPKGNPAKVTGPEDLLDARVRHLALAGEKVPAGEYAQQALTQLELYEKLVDAKRIVRGHDVRATLLLVERGEAEAGIVYATDARVAKDVEVVATFAAETHEPIVYPLVLTIEGAKKKQSQALFDYLQTEAAGKIFAKHGFAKPPKPKPPQGDRE